MFVLSKDSEEAADGGLIFQNIPLTCCKQINTLPMMLFIIAVFILPLLFQVIFGTGNQRFLALKFWQVCLISVILGLFALSVNFLLLNYFLTKNGSHDGLPFVALMALATFTGVLLLFMIAVQIYINHRKATKHEVK